MSKQLYTEKVELTISVTIITIVFANEAHPHPRHSLRSQ